MNILIADDHPLYREALANILRNICDTVFIYEVDSFTKLNKFLKEENVSINLVLLDLYMAGGNWKQVIKSFVDKYPDTPLIVVSSSESMNDASLAMEAGAHGYIPKSLSRDEIINSIRLMMRGEISIHPRIERTEYEESGDNTMQQQALDNFNKLTERQKQVLGHIKVGESNKIIARKLSMTEGTVKLHVAAILRQLGVKNRTQAALIANKLFDGS